MKITIAVLLALPLAFVPAAERQDPEPCLMKNLIDAYHCSTCSKVFVKKELASKKTYYACSSCGSIELKAGKCADCDQARSKSVSGDNVCPECFGRPKVRQACEVVYYECPSCEAADLVKGKCEACDAGKRKKTKTSRALVIYECPECGRSSVLPGTCPNRDCDNFGKDLTPRCTQSGKFPHGPSTTVVADEEEDKDDDGNSEDDDQDRNDGRR